MPFSSIKDVNFSSKTNSQVMWNLLFDPLIGNFKSDIKFLICFFFLWQLISCQTLKLSPKIYVWKKKINQWQENKTMLNHFDLKFTFGPYMIYFCFLWLRIILTVDFEKEGHSSIDAYSIYENLQCISQQSAQHHVSC